MKIKIVKQNENEDGDNYVLQKGNKFFNLAAGWVNKEDATLLSKSLAKHFQIMESYGS